MATKISELPATTAETGTELIPVVQGGVTSQSTFNKILTFVKAAFSPAGGAALIGNTPAGNIASTTVQAALNELDTEKAALAGATFTGAVSATGFTGPLTGNVTGNADTATTATNQSGGTVNASIGILVVVQVQVLVYFNWSSSGCCYTNNSSYSYMAVTFRAQICGTRE